MKYLIGKKTKFFFLSFPSYYLTFYDRDLYLLFRRFGTILSVHIMVNKTSGLSKGYGFVSFAFPEDAASAIELMDGFRVRLN